MGHVGSKSRLLSQIIEKPCVHSRGHSFDPTFMKLCQKDDPHEIKVKFKTGTCWVKTLVTRSNYRKPCVHFREDSFESKFTKLCQNINLHKI